MYNPESRSLVRGCLLTLALCLTLGILSLGISDAKAVNLSVKSDEPIKIEADRAELDDKIGKSTYSGNVIITQGKSSLKATQVVIFSDQDGIRQFTATGDLAHLVQYDAKTDTETHAYAKEILFERSSNQVILRKNARLEQQTSSFQGEEIIYNTLKRVVTANSDPTDENNSRVNIIYQPSKTNPQ